MGKKVFSRNRPGTEEQLTLSTLRPPSISTGKRETIVLNYLKEHKGQAFNRRGFAREYNIPPASVKDILERLKRKGFVGSDFIGDWYITESGERQLQKIEESQGTVREDGRGRKNLSMHASRFVLELERQTQVSQELQEKIKASRYKKVELPNFTQHHFYFDDGTITINEKTVVIYIRDILDTNIEIASFEAVQKALSYVSLLESVGVVGKGLRLEDAHFARVKSALSEKLQEVDKHYMITLPSGKRFWIDNSTGVHEDETDDIRMRKRTDEFMIDLYKTDYNLSDIGTLMHLTKDLVTISTNLVRIETMQKAPMPLDDGKNNKMVNYFG